VHVYKIGLHQFLYFFKHSESYLIVASNSDYERLKDACRKNIKVDEYKLDSCFKTSHHSIKKNGRSVLHLHQ